MNLHLFSIFLIIFQLSITNAAENDDDTDELIIPPQLFDADNIDVSIPVPTSTHESDSLSSTILSEVSSHEEINLGTNPVTETISSGDNIDTDDTQSITDSLLLVSAKVEVDEQNSMLETTSVVIVKSISNEQIEAEITRIKDSIRSYDNDQQLKEHPMIAHFRKIAHGYTICCKPYVTSETFNRYKQHMGKPTDDYDIIYNMLRACEARLSTKQILHDVHQQCDAALSDVTTAMLTRHEYMENSKKEINTVFEKYGYYFDLNEIDRTIISDQDLYVTKYCPNEDVIELMFDFKKLLTCEELIRQNLHSSPDEYNLYTKNYSEPFQDMIFTKWDRMRTMIEYLNSQQTLQSGEKIIKLVTVPYKTILSDMESNRIALEMGGVELKYSDHPLITYLSKRAHAYAVCCKPYETRQLFNQYLDNFYANHDAGNLLNKIIDECYQTQVHQFSSEFSKKCQNAYDDVSEAANRRQQFVRDHEKQYPHMESDYTKTFNLHSDLQRPVYSKKAYVDEYCPNVHVMELIYDIGKLLECEKSIRYGLSSSPEKYKYYEHAVSNGFRRFIGVHWDAMTGYIRKYDKQVVSGSTEKLETSTLFQASTATKIQTATPSPASIGVKNQTSTQVQVPTPAKLQASTPVQASIGTPIKKHKNAPIVSNEQIQSDINNIKNRLKNSGYNEAHDHPMVAYFPKLAHAYIVCCKMNATPLKFLMYFRKVDTFSYRSDILDVFSYSCDNTHFVIPNNPCSDAYSDLQESMDEARTFADDYTHEHPDEKTKLEDSIHPEKLNINNIEAVHNYVEKYCPNDHVIELLFNLEKYFKCEELIRYGLQSSLRDYQYYATISSEFTNKIDNSWRSMSSHVKSLKKTHKHKKTPTTKKKHRPVHSSPNKISQSQNQVASISSSGTSIHRTIYSYFTLSFIIVVFNI